jgi:hypothetical protein
MIIRTLAAVVVTAVVLVTACADAGPAEAGPERAAYLTLMGSDTLAIEWMEFGDGYVDAQALIRGSRTTFGEYRLEMSEEGEVTAYAGNVYAGGSNTGELLRSTVLVHDEAGQSLVVSQGGEERRTEFAGEPGSVPFIDMLHWPFETALRWQAGRGEMSEDIPTFTGRGMRFGLIANDDGSWGLRHPSRGVSTMEMDAEGKILRLDGTGSTRAYQLSRIPYDQLEPGVMGATFADRPLGELSGRGQIDDTVAGVHFTGDYGTPRRRGRDIFGALLAYGVWWRTGANRATHFSLDGDIVIDGKMIPAGDYTLSSIPEEDGGTLIINTRTGQGGQSYDETLDLARVELRRDRLDETVEVFEIRVVELESGGRIELRWDDTVYWVPFTVP